MTAVARRTQPRDRFPGHSPLRLAATIVMTVIASLMLCMCMALAVIGAADAAGVDISAPIPQPSLAPPGLDR